MNNPAFMPRVNTPGLSLFIPGDITTPSVRLVMHYSNEANTYKILGVTYENPIDGVTLTGVKTMAMREKITQQLRESIAEKNPEMLTAFKRLTAYLKNRKARPMAEKTYEKLRNSDLVEVYLTYRVARMCRDYPIMAVAQAFGVDRQKARTLVRAARSIHEKGQM